MRVTAGVMRPPTSPVRVKDPRIPAGPENYGDARLRKVYQLIPGVSWIDLRVDLSGKPDVPLAVDVSDINLREPLARFLEKHKGKTITELGNLEVDF